MTDRPDCYKCKYRHGLLGDEHSGCNNKKAKTTFNAHGIKMGWAFWPYNFDPIWLLSCDGFEPIQKKEEVS